MVLQMDNAGILKLAAKLVAAAERAEIDQMPSASTKSLVE